MLAIVVLFFLICCDPVQAFCPKCQQEQCTCDLSSPQDDIQETEESAQEEVTTLDDRGWINSFLKELESLGPYKVNEDAAGAEKYPKNHKPYRDGILVTPLLVSVKDDDLFVREKLKKIKETIDTAPVHMYLVKLVSLWIKLLIFPLDSALLSDLLYLPRPTSKDETFYFYRLKNPFKLVEKQQNMQLMFDLVNEEIKSYMINLTPSRREKDTTQMLRHNSLTLTLSLVLKLGRLREQRIKNEIKYSGSIFEELVRFGHIQLAVPAFKYVGRISQEGGDNPFSYDVDGDVNIVDVNHIPPYIDMLYAAGSSLVKFDKDLMTCSGPLISTEVYEVNELYKRLVVDLNADVENITSLDVNEKKSIIRLTIKDQYSHVDSAAPKRSRRYVSEKTAVNTSYLISPLEITGQPELEAAVKEIEKSINLITRPESDWITVYQTKKQAQQLLSFDTIIDAQNLLKLTRRLLNTLGKVRINNRACLLYGDKGSQKQTALWSPFLVFEKADHFEIVSTLLKLHRQWLRDRSNPEVLWDYALLALLVSTPQWEDIKYLFINKREVKTRSDFGALLKFMPDEFHSGRDMIVAVDAIFQSVDDRSILVKELFKKINTLDPDIKKISEAIHFLEALAQVFRNFHDGRFGSTIKVLQPLLTSAESGFIPARDLMSDIYKDKQLTSSKKMASLWNRIQKQIAPPSVQSSPSCMTTPPAAMSLESEQDLYHSEAITSLLDQWDQSLPQKGRQKKIYRLLMGKKNDVIEKFLEIIEKDKSGGKVLPKNKERLKKMLQLIGNDVSQDDLLLSQHLASITFEREEPKHRVIRLYLVIHACPGNLSKAAHLLSLAIRPKQKNEWLIKEAEDDISYSTMLLLLSAYVQEHIKDRILSIIEDKRPAEIIYNTIMTLHEWESKGRHISSDKLKVIAVYLIKKITEPSMRERLLSQYIQPEKSCRTVLKWLNAMQALAAGERGSKNAKKRFEEFKQSVADCLEDENEQLSLRNDLFQAGAVTIPALPPYSDTVSSFKATLLSPSNITSKESRHGLKDLHGNLSMINESETSCGVCLIEYQTEPPKNGKLDQRPTTLAKCGHTFCMSCMLKIANQKEKLIECPLCRKIMPLTEKFEDDCVPSFSMMKLLGSIRELSRSQSSK